MMNWILLQTSVATEEAGEITFSYFDLALKGGIVMIPILLMSFIAVYIFIERFFIIKKAGKTDKNFMNRIKDYIHDDKIEAAFALCQSTDSPTSRMISKGLRRLGKSLQDVHAAIETVGKLEISKLEKGLPILATISGGAPMVGFLGTVTGMVRAFYDMSVANNNIDVKLLSGGIYEALVTTVAGLIVGITAYFAYNYLVTRVERVVFQLEADTTEFMDLLNEPIN
jgi:biopolymer transport protein ExbB